MPLALGIINSDQCQCKPLFKRLGSLSSNRLSSKTSSLPYVCTQPAADLIREFLFMLYNVLQVCHGGHSLQGLYVRVRTNRVDRCQETKGWGGEPWEDGREQSILLTAFLVI